jgi:hypothetical protein
LRIHLDNYRIIFVVVGLIGILLFAAPTIGVLVKPPAGEQFSELYLLGPDHLLKNIPFIIKTGATYTVYLGVGNQMGVSSYYTCFVKLRNETEALPNQTLASPSSLPALYEFNSFIQTCENWETSLTFQVNKLTITDGTSHLSSITINGIDFSLDKESTFSSEKAGYYYSLFIELWIFNSTSNILQYHNRAVHLNLYMTN